MTTYHRTARSPGGGTYRLERREDETLWGPEPPDPSPRSTAVESCRCADHAAIYSSVLGVEHWQCSRCLRCWDACSSCGHVTDSIPAPRVCPGCGRDRRPVRSGPADLASEYELKPSASADSKSEKGA